MKTKKMLLPLIAALTINLQYSTASLPVTKKNHTIEDIKRILEEETSIQTGMPSLKTMLYDENNFTTSNLQRMYIRPSNSYSKTSKFNQTFLKYIKESYNEQDYANIISQDGRHIIDFLELSSEMNLDAQTNYVCLRLFYNKIKECELIDETMINQIMPHFYKHLDRFFCTKKDILKTKDIPSFKPDINLLINNTIKFNLPNFKSLNHFTQTISNEVINFLKQKRELIELNQNKRENKERLRQIIIRFFETAISKTIWNPQAPEGVWQSFISIANNLQLLGSRDIINHMDDLDDLLWTLTHRFCYFLELSGSTLPIELYDEIESDLENKLIFFLESPEQDTGIKTKKATLYEALMKAKTKAIAYYKNGLLLNYY